jgi:hypothetical protein
LDTEVLIRNKETKNKDISVAPHGIAVFMVVFMSPLLVRKLNDFCDKQFINELLVSCSSLQKDMPLDSSTLPIRSSISTNEKTVNDRVSDLVFIEIKA